MDADRRACTRLRVDGSSEAGRQPSFTQDEASTLRWSPRPPAETTAKPRPPTPHTGHAEVRDETDL